MLVVARRWRRGPGERVVEVVVLAGAFAAGPDVVHVVAWLFLGVDFRDVSLAWVPGIGSSVAQAGAVGLGVGLGGLGHFFADFRIVWRPGSRF